MAAPTEPLDVLVENYVKRENSSVINEIVTGIVEDKLQILQLVESLGSTLTDKDVQTRAKGSELLAETLQLLPKQQLNKKEAEVFSQFFRDRLKDHHSITPHVLSGIQSLIQSPVLPESDIELCVRAVFQEIHIQSLTQGDRRCLYHIVDYLLSQKLSCLQKMGPDFVFGFIQAMDGEKDPRNLVIAFRCVRNIAKLVSLGTLAEDLFEVVACYFPIDFTPPINNPNGITKEMLVLGLREALASNAKFAEFCLPLLLEKLTSTIKSAKIDSFLTLVSCAEVYGEKINEYTGSLWSCIRREVLAASSESLEDAALRAMSAIVRTLSQQVTESGKVPALGEFVQEVYNDVKRHLCEPEQRLVVPAGKVLRSIAMAAAPARDQLVPEVVALLLDQYNTHKQVTDRRAIIGELNVFIPLLTGDLKGRSGDLYELYTSLLSHSNPSLCHLGVQGTLGLIRLPGVLTTEEVDQCSQYFQKIAFDVEDKTCRSNAITGLGEMCTKMTSGGVTRLCGQLCQMLDTNEKSEAYDLAKNQRVLDVIAGSCASTEMVKSMVPFLLSRLQAANQTSITSAIFPIYPSICTCLHDTISRNIHHSASREYLYSVVLERILDLCLEGTKTQDCVLNDWRILRGLSGSVRQIMCALNKSECEKTLSSVTKLFTSDNQLDFKPFNLDSPPSHTQLLVLFTAVICSGPLDTVIPERETIVDKLLVVATRCQHQESAISAVQCLAGLVNKAGDDDYLNTLIQSTHQQVTDTLTSASNSETDQRNALNVIIWLTKALLLRSHRHQKQWIELLLSQLSHPSLGQDAADGFGVVLSHCYEVLREDQHARVMFMYRQRMFILTVDALIQGFHDTTQSERKIPYLVAISHLLNHVPQDAMGAHLPKLLPLLLRCLQTPGGGDQLWTSTLGTLGTIVAEAPQLVGEYVDELTGHLLRLAQYKPKMTVRITALVSLRQLTRLPDTLTLPHQRRVTQGLTAVLDDHKRLVRREAVATREQWILIDAPGT